MEHELQKALAIYEDRGQWTTSDQELPGDLWQLIKWRYVEPLRQLAIVQKVVLVPSARSCYRPKDYEREHGRSGNSLHCFPPGSFGACDIRRLDGGHIREVIDTVIERTPFRRIALYPGHGFIHVDYGDGEKRPGTRRSLWLCEGPLQPWVFMSHLAGPVVGP